MKVRWLDELMANTRVFIHLFKTQLIQYPFLERRKLLVVTLPVDGVSTADTFVVCNGVDVPRPEPNR